MPSRLPEPPSIQQNTSFRELFNRLIPPYNQLAIDAYNSQADSEIPGVEPVDERFGISIGQAIMAITWGQAPQGDDHWRKLWNDIDTNGLKSRYIISYPIRVSNRIPLWAATPASLNLHLARAMNVPIGATMEPRAMCYNNVHASKRFCLEYAAGTLNDRKEGGIYTYRNNRSRTAEYGLYSLDGTSVIFRVRKPKDYKGDDIMTKEYRNAIKRYSSLIEVKDEV